MTCETCKQQVQPSGRCACCCLLADALQKYLGMDFYTATMRAAILWDTEADTAYVHSGEFNDHEV